MKPMKTTEHKPVPSLKQIEAVARKLVDERILRKGGQMPSEKAVDVFVKAMAMKAKRQSTKD